MFTHAILVSMLGVIAVPLSAPEVAFTAAEALALATVLKTVLLPLLKGMEWWDKLPRPAKTAIVFAIALLAAFLEGVATGKPALLSVLLAVTAAGAAVGAHKAERKRAKRKAADVKFGPKIS